MLSISYRLTSVAFIDPVIHLVLEDEISSAPRIGLAAAHVETAYYLTKNMTHPLPLELYAGSKENGRCEFWEPDPKLMPGLYAFKVPQFLRNNGTTFVHFNFPQAKPIYLKIFSVDYDPYDAFALGLGTWVRSNCHENLTSGLRKSMPPVLLPLLDEWLGDSV